MKNTNFLERIFLLPDDNSYAEDSILGLIDIACNMPHKSEEFSNKAINYITNLKNNKSIKIHERYQK